MVATLTAVIALVLATALWPLRRQPVQGAGPASDVSDDAPRPQAWSRVLALAPGRRRGIGAASTDEVADALVLLALALRAGLGLMEAVDQVQRCSEGRARGQLGVVVAALRWGRPASEAWRFAGPAWRDAALAWHVAESTGAPPADLLEQASARLREAQEREGERRAARAGVLLVLPLGLGFLPAFACTAVIPVVVALAGGVLRG